jgi:hypothetical protein
MPTYPALSMRLTIQSNTRLHQIPRDELQSTAQAWLGLDPPGPTL